MSYANYEVKFGDYNGFTDITDRVRGLQTSVKCRVGELNSAEATLTLDNDDGAFTPGIGGTYSSVDLFSQAVIINKGSSTYPLFHGIVDQVQYFDNGTNSTVQLQCVDALTVGGRSPNGYIRGSYTIDLDYEMIESLYNGLTSGGVVYFEPCGLPTLDGGTTPTVSVEVMDTLDTGSVFNYFVSFGLGDNNVKSVLNNDMMPAFLGVGWPTTIDVTGGSAVYNCQLVQQLTRESATKFSFGGASGIPIQTLEAGFRTDLLYNSATADQEPGGAGPVTLQDTASIEKYGVRHINVNLLKAYRSISADPVWAEDFFTQNYSTRFTEVRYTPIRMTVLLEAAEAENIAEATMHQLMSIDDGIWQLAEITYRPTGAATDVTELCVIAGRTISAVPGRTTIDLELLPAVDYQSFVLNSNDLGVLNQNRLG